MFSFDFLFYVSCSGSIVRHDFEIGMKLVKHDPNLTVFFPRWINRLFCLNPDMQSSWLVVEFLKEEIVWGIFFF